MVGVRGWPKRRVKVASMEVQRDMVVVGGGFGKDYVCRCVCVCVAYY